MGGVGRRGFLGRVLGGLAAVVGVKSLSGGEALPGQEDVGTAKALLPDWAFEHWQPSAAPLKALTDSLKRAPKVVSPNRQPEFDWLEDMDLLAKMPGPNAEIRGLTAEHLIVDERDDRRAFEDFLDAALKIRPNVGRKHG